MYIFKRGQNYCIKTNNDGLGGMC